MIILSRRQLKLYWPNQLFGLMIISLIAWGQSGFSLDEIRLLFILTNYFVWFLLLPWINGWVHQQKSWKSIASLSSALQWLCLLSAHWVISNIIFYITRFVLLDYNLFPSMDEVLGYLLPSIVSRAIDLSLFAGLLAWAYQNRLLHERKMEIAEKEAELQRSKLQSLKNQLNPHFLFNSMHNIASLIGQDDDAAQKLTIKMSHLLRKIMVINEKEEHTLQEEWDFVKDYLEIESERFKDRLILDTSFDEQLGSSVVPTFILQPLVENAFKHGVAHEVNPTKLNIVAVRKDQVDKIVVSNQLFDGKKNVSSAGVGLKNLKERLYTYYNGKAELIIESGHSSFTATIKIPNEL